MAFGERILVWTKHLERGLGIPDGDGDWAGHQPMFEDGRPPDVIATGRGSRHVP